MNVGKLFLCWSAISSNVECPACSTCLVRALLLESLLVLWCCCRPFPSIFDTEKFQCCPYSTSYTRGFCRCRINNPMDNIHKFHKEFDCKKYKTDTNNDGNSNSNRNNNNTPDISSPSMRHDFLSICYIF